MTTQTKLISAAIVIVIAVGGVAAAVSHGSKDKKSVAQTQSVKPTNTVPRQINQTTSQPAATQWLNIPQWGVRIPLSSPISDLYYSMSSDGTMATFSTKNLADKYGCTAENVGLSYSLVRFTSKSSGEENVQPSFKQIGNYWYSIGSAQASCLSEENQAANDAIGQVLEPLKNALLSVEAM